MKSERRPNTTRGVSRLIRRCLNEGHAIEIEGLGMVRRNDDGACEWLPDTRPRVFIAYALEERATAVRLRQSLEAAGFDPWLDIHKLMPGQNWRRAIAQAIELADYFVACFSKKSIKKRGGFQRELRQALDIAENVPIDRPFLIPLRLDDCEPPAEFSRRSQWVDIFPEAEPGVKKLVRAIRRYEKARG
jgi:hypothetical protein